MPLKEDHPGPRLAAPPAQERMSRPTLPPATTGRWTARRKAQVVEAIWRGHIGREQAGRLYGCSEEELRSWEKALERHGLSGLQPTKLHRFRQPGAVAKSERALGVEGKSLRPRSRKS